MITAAEEDRPPMGRLPSMTPDRPVFSGYRSPSAFAAPRRWSAQSPARVSGTALTKNCARLGKFSDCSSMTPFCLGR